MYFQSINQKKVKFYISHRCVEERELQDGPKSDCFSELITNDHAMVSGRKAWHVVCQKFPNFVVKK